MKQDPIRVVAVRPYDIDGYHVEQGMVGTVTRVDKDCTVKFDRLPVPIHVPNRIITTSEALTHIKD